MSPVRRRINAATLQEKTRPYWWFQGDSVRELLARLTESPDARLEVHLAENQKMTFVVLPSGEAATRDPIRPPINESHVCPPSCP
jgi:hypothetical protein